MHDSALTDDERARYQWQLWVRDFGEPGQQRLKQSTVLVSRIGGLGGLVAYELAAAGVGRLILAHAGRIKPSDLNRQLLMTTDAVGELRVEVARRRLQELNPLVDVVAVPENVSLANAADLSVDVDLIVDCAPLFAERYAMNAAAVERQIPLVECAMYDLQASLTVVVPGQTPCLACLYPEPPPTWQREFPVFGAVSGALGCLAAMEAIKTLAGFGRTLTGSLLLYDLRTLQFRTLEVFRRPSCHVCGALVAPLQE
jgi:molybdopterin/thiamine biosynthesis adenylyltransferase